MPRRRGLGPRLLAAVIRSNATLAFAAERQVVRQTTSKSSVRKVAVFGNAGAGKSTLARKLAELTRLPLYPIDMIQYPGGNTKIPHEEYLRIHSELLGRDAWIIDGYGCRDSTWERLAAADTLVYIDLPVSRHFAWITKRLLSGMFRTPEGWPKGSPMIRSTISSYRVLWLCHRHLTPKYRDFVAKAQGHKRVHHLKSVRDIGSFLSAVRMEAREHEGAA